MVHDASAIRPDDSIEIEVPLHASRAATLRLLVASLGAEAGFSIDELDDLKLAVSEIFTLLIEAAPPDGNGRGRLRLMIDDSGFAMHLRNPQSAEPIELDALSATILASVTDEHHVDADGVRIVKRVAESMS